MPETARPVCGKPLGTAPRAGHLRAVLTKSGNVRSRSVEQPPALVAASLARYTKAFPESQGFTLADFPQDRPPPRPLTMEVLMSFMNNFYDNNYGMMQTFNTINHMRTAANAEQAAAAAATVAAEQRKARESQERMEASQRRMEQQAKDANKQKLRIEQEKLELEKARHEADLRQREQAAAFRRFTAFSMAFTEKVIAALD